MRLKELGWKPTGIDVSDRAVQSARSLSIEAHHCNLASFARTAPRRFDLIRFASVLEHLEDPLTNLRHAAQLLENGGRILLILPNSDSWMFRVFKSYWFALELPRHLCHFTSRTLSLAVASAGLSIESIHLSTRPRDLQRSLAYVFPRLRRTLESGMARRILSPFVGLLDVVGGGDQMVAVLKRALDP